MSAVTTGKQRKQKQPLPAPLVHMWRHPLRWAAIFAVTLVTGIIAGHLGPLIVTGAYDTFLQAFWPVKHAWDHIPVYWRHMFFRDYQEFFLGGMFFQFIGWNIFTGHHRRTMKKLAEGRQNRLDRLEERLGIPTLHTRGDLRGWQIPYGFLWAEIYGGVGFFLVWAGSLLIHHYDAAGHLLPAAHGTSWWATAQNVDLSGKLSHIEGLVAAFIFGRRPMGKVFDGVQSWFAERRYGKPDPLYFRLLPHYAAKVHDIAQRIQSGELAYHPEHHGKMQNWAFAASAVIGLALAAYGYEVLNYHHVWHFGPQ